METILVVEDNRSMQRTLQRLLELDGLQVQIAGDGAAGLELFRKQIPCAVILDLKLPRLPGKELCRSFKAMAPSVPIVVLVPTPMSRTKCSCSSLAPTTT